MEQTKICTKCGIEKPLTEFCKDKYRKNGLSYTCKQCRIIITKKDYLKNKECYKQKNKEYRLKNKGKIKEASKKYYLKNKDKIKEASKKYYLKNKEAYKKYCLKNKDKIKEASLKYDLKNRDKIKQTNKKYRDTLADGYMSSLLNIPLKECAPELIELKRAQIKLIRIHKEKTNL